MGQSVIAGTGWRRPDRWWIDRLRSALAQADVVRIDHFRGFAAYWEVPAEAETAVTGRWVQGPGADFFRVLQHELGDDLPIVAEDLGDITQEVLDLRDEFGLPGMKVLQFGFGGRADNLFLPHNYTEPFVAYSGTHDNDTSRGWYESSSTPEERDHFRRYFATDGRDVAWTMIRESSLGRTGRSLQDILQVGAEGRMNPPGRGNWQCAPCRCASPACRTPAGMARQAASARSRHRSTPPPLLRAVVMIGTGQQDQRNLQVDEFHRDLPPGLFSFIQTPQPIRWLPG